MNRSQQRKSLGDATNEGRRGREKKREVKKREEIYRWELEQGSRRLERVEIWGRGLGRG